METWIWIIIVIVALIGGAAIGFFAARQYMMKYLKENPPINEQMLRMMMAQMGRKPSEKQVKQMMNQMNKMQNK
ncbi:YneF family protein [Bacillus sp. FJAT-22090]|uniref:YneF family protein n=1 Tax=Bacillus sp. FJAT-22090 TaxID=1581038 RepID=UPI0011A970A9|nr:YneF family protein [Bacillus sp. FJAT-22090]